jgi:hypothetical protein
MIETRGVETGGVHEGSHKSPVSQKREGVTSIVFAHNILQDSDTLSRRRGLGVQRDLCYISLFFSRRKLKHNPAKLLRLT